MFSFNAPRVVLTPCIGICELDTDDLCVGCHRTRNEIALWGSMSDTERLYVMNHVLPEREQAQARTRAERA